MINQAKKTKGFTLVELMIAMSLGLVLSAGTIQLFVMVKKIVEHQQVLMRLQESMQTTTFIMGKAIRQAGNMGGLKWQNALSKEIDNNINLREIGLWDNKVIRVCDIETLRKNKLVVPSVLSRMKKNSDILWVLSSENSSQLKNNDIVVKTAGSHLSLLKFLEHGIKPRQSRDEQTRKLSSVFYYITQDNGLYSVAYNENAVGHVEGVENLKVNLKPNSVSLQFVFSSGLTPLVWEQEWAIRK